MSGTVQGEGAERAEVRVCPMDPDYLPYTPYTRGGSLSLSLPIVPNAISPASLPTRPVLVSRRRRQAR
jgi:hypothetical protein